ncbi:Crp/Fnr family transcriptional regulator [bacterium]|nr:Crp/Fnr family transcriptional regulator [bacterium]
MAKEQEAVDQYLQLSPAGREVLRRGLVVKGFAKPTAVIHKGQQVSGAYLVTQGQLRVFTYTPQGSEATLYFIRPGETCVLALNCLFNDLRYPAWVETDAATRVAVISGPTYRGLFESEAAVQDMTVKALSTLVFRLMGELEQIHSCTLDQRLANFLLSNASEQGAVRMTQQELASHLGTTREVVARLMQSLTAQGLVSTGRGTITLLDTQGLSERAKPV